MVQTCRQNWGLTCSDRTPLRWTLQRAFFRCLVFLIYTDHNGMLFEPLRPTFCQRFIQTVCRPLFLVSAVEHTWQPDRSIQGSAQKDSLSNLHGRKYLKPIEPRIQLCLNGCYGLLSRGRLATGIEGLPLTTTRSTLQSLRRPLLYGFILHTM
jgi:hypothetical protein